MVSAEGMNMIYPKTLLEARPGMIKKQNLQKIF